MKITYCKRCLYPSNAKPTIIFDNDGVCSGCRYHEQRFKIKIDWTERKKLLDNIIEEAKVNSKKIDQVMIVLCRSAEEKTQLFKFGI